MKFRISNLESRNGFTLLEVVVAMSIVGLGVVTLLQVFSSGLRLSTRSSTRTEAISSGTSLMNEVLARPEIREGSEAGAAGEAGRWNLQVKIVREETQLLSLNPWELREITLQVPYRDGAGEKRLEMKTLRLVRKKNP